MRGRAALVLPAAAVAVAVAVASVSAGPPADQLSGHLDRVLAVLEDPALAAPDKSRERRAAVRQVATDLFDFPEMSRRSLGRHWAARTAAEREEFVGLFVDLLERTYIGRISSYSGEKVVLLGDVVDGNLATVRTKIVTRTGTEVPVDYRLLRQGERWRAYDVSIEGVSLVANYRSQFDRIIQQGSFADLVRKIKDKRAEGQASRPQ